MEDGDISEIVPNVSWRNDDGLTIAEFGSSLDEESEIRLIKFIRISPDQ